MINKKTNNLLLKLSAIILIVVLSVLSARRTEAAQTSFPDVAKTAWYRDAVTWAIDEKVTSGRGGYFLPDKTCTRAEAVTFLYNFAGRPSVKANTSFADVKSSSLWYYNAVAWAVNNHITSGYGTVDGKPIFSPDTVCSRAMIVTMLGNYAEHIDNCYKPCQDAGRSFPDVRSGQWYYESVSWASASGVANGKGDGKFHPNDSCTRAQIVTFIYNYRMRVAPGHVHSWVTETVIDKKAYDEQVLVKKAYDEQVLVKKAYDEKKLVKEAYDEQVLVRDAYTEEIGPDATKLPDGARKAEPIYVYGCTCNTCGEFFCDDDDIIETEDLSLVGQVIDGKRYVLDGGPGTAGAKWMRHSLDMAYAWEAAGKPEDSPLYGHGRWHNDFRVLGYTVYYDAQYETVHHDAEYKTVHHDAEYKTVHHDAEYKTVHHDAVTHTVTRCSTCGEVK